MFEPGRSFTTCSAIAVGVVEIVEILENSDNRCTAGNYGVDLGTNRIFVRNNCKATFRLKVYSSQPSYESTEIVSCSSRGINLRSAAQVWRTGED